MNILAMLALLAQLGTGYQSYKTVSDGTTLYSVFVGPTQVAGLDEKLLAIVNEPTLSLARVTIFESEDAANLATSGTGNDITYQIWSTRRREADVRCLPVLDVMRIGQDVVSRRVDHDCGLATRTLKESNPLVIEMRPGTEVIDVSLRRMGSELGVTWEVRTDGPVDADAAERFANRLLKLAPLPNAMLMLRRDPWFMGPGLINPFVLGKPPAKQQYLDAPEAVCVLLSGWPMHCWMERLQ